MNLNLKELYSQQVFCQPTQHITSYHQSGSDYQWDINRGSRLFSLLTYISVILMWSCDSYVILTYMVTLYDYVVLMWSWHIFAFILTWNLRLKFLYTQNRFLTPSLRRVLCNALIQSLFDYACIAWFSSLSKRLKLLLKA